LNDLPDLPKAAMVSVLGMKGDVRRMFFAL